MFVLQSAGNLATTQEVLDRIDRDLATPGDHESLATVDHLFEAALYVGRLSREVCSDHRDGARRVGADGTATFILGGQIGGEPPDIFLVYPEGNYIRASDDRPFLQIGESKYGKFMLELAVERRGRTGHRGQDRARLDDEHRPRQPVGRPAVRRRHVAERWRAELVEFRVEDGSPTLAQLHEMWERHLRNAVAELPSIAPGEIGPI